MGVYVKGMKMPKSCANCRFSDWRGGDTAHCRIIEAAPQGNLLCRPEWCPLIDVSTPHGRLIDADKAAEVMLFEMCGTGYQSKAMRILQSDLYTPTVIESEN